MHCSFSIEKTRTLDVAREEEECVILSWWRFLSSRSHKQYDKATHKCVYWHNENVQLIITLLSLNWSDDNTHCRRQKRITRDNVLGLNCAFWRTHIQILVHFAFFSSLKAISFQCVVAFYFEHTHTVQSSSISPERAFKQACVHSFQKKTTTTKNCQANLKWW